MFIVCSNYDLYSAQHMDMLWFGDKPGYGVARHKNGDPCKWREHAHTAKPNINTNRALNHVDKLGLAELALAEVTCSVYHEVSVGSPLRERVAVCGIRSSRGYYRWISAK